MRVVHVHRIRGIGGSERHLLTLLPALAERGVEPVFLGLDDPAWDAEPLLPRARGRVGPAAVPARPRPAARAAGAPRDRAPRADVVHTHLVHADVYGALGAGRGARSSRRSTTTTASGAGPFRFVERGRRPARRRG